MRVWLSRGTSISIKEQLSSQFLLGILSGRLKAGEKLPSVRELARHLQIHSNTVSAAYRDLAGRGWVSARSGSGVFVLPTGLRKTGGAIDEFVRAWAADGAAQGFSRAALQDALTRLGSEEGLRALVVADPDVEFARVLALEIGEGIGAAVGFSSIREVIAEGASGRRVLVNAAHLAELPDGVAHTAIRLKSMQDVVAGQKRPSRPVLVAVVSRSEEILRWSSTLLAALGFSSEAVIQRNPRDAGWRQGLAACDIVAADVVAHAELSGSVAAIEFRVVAEDFIEELRGAGFG